VFSYSSSAEKKAKHTSIAELIANPYYSVLAITVPTFSVDEPKTLSHFIVGAALFTCDNRSGSYFLLIGVSDKGDPHSVP
jgi:hypothetical protein